MKITGGGGEGGHENSSQVGRKAILIFDRDPVRMPRQLSRRADLVFPGVGQRPGDGVRPADGGGRQPGSAPTVEAQP